MSTAGGTQPSRTDKANDYAVEALKQVLTLASVILALTITFMKDALGDARAGAVWRPLIPVAWALLLLVVWTAWVAIADAARDIGTGTATDYAFKDGRTRHLARIAQWSFILALACFAAFATRNLHLVFAPPKVKMSEEVRTKRLVVVDDSGKVVWKAP